MIQQFSWSASFLPHGLFPWQEIRPRVQYANLQPGGKSPIFFPLVTRWGACSLFSGGQRFPSGFSVSVSRRVRDLSFFPNVDA